MTKPYFEYKKRFIIKPFPYTVFLVISSDVMESRNKYKKQLGEYNGVTAEGLHVCFENLPVSYIFLKYDTDIEVVVHEAFHCIWQIMDYVGAKLEEEVTAYHLGALVGDVCSFLAKTERELEALDKVAT